MIIVFMIVSILLLYFNHRPYYMDSTIFHIYGPFAVHSYGLCIALGLLLFVLLTKREILRSNLASEEVFISTIIWGCLTAFFGGRVLYLLNNWDSVGSIWEIFELWYGGLSILGAVIAPLVVMPFYLIKKNVPVLPFFDVIALHLPLWQSIARIGCFFAGCCYGRATSAVWGVLHYDESGIYQYVHPTQLYSAALLFLIFLLLYHIAYTRATKPGQLTMLYLILISMERFGIDILRGDRQFLDAVYMVSLNQLVAIVLFLSAIGWLTFITYRPKRV